MTFVKLHTTYIILLCKIVSHVGYLEIIFKNFPQCINIRSLHHRCEGVWNWTKEKESKSNRKSEIHTDSKVAIWLCVRSIPGGKFHSRVNSCTFNHDEDRVLVTITARVIFIAEIRRSPLDIRLTSREHRARESVSRFVVKIVRA